VRIKFSTVVYQAVKDDCVVSRGREYVVHYLINLGNKTKNRFIPVGRATVERI
jgi:hypothetical protein